MTCSRLVPLGVFLSVLATACSGAPGDLAAFGSTGEPAVEVDAGPPPSPSTSADAGPSASPPPAPIPPSAGEGADAGTSASDADAGAACDPSHPCAAGSYCATASTASACGAGRCAPSPSACPLIDEPVCGCDGRTYLNSCWATRGQPGTPGTVTSGRMFVAPAMDDITGTWSRASGDGAAHTAETLVLDPSGTYTLIESTGSCATGSAGSDCAVGSTSGTFSLTTVGIILNATTASNADTLATELYFENTCPIGGARVFSGAEPPEGNAMVTLVRE